MSKKNRRSHGAAERRPSGKTFEECASDGINIRPTVDLDLTALLRAHVAWAAKNIATAGEALLVSIVPGHLGQSKIENFHFQFAGPGK